MSRVSSVTLCRLLVSWCVCSFGQSVRAAKMVVDPYVSLLDELVWVHVFGCCVAGSVIRLYNVGSVKIT